MKYEGTQDLVLVHLLPSTSTVVLVVYNLNNMTMKLHIYQEVHVCGTGTEGGCMLYKTHQIQFLRLKEIVLLLLYSTV